MPAVRRHDALQWCLKMPGLLEMQHDDSMVPPIWFLLTAPGEALLAMRGDSI